MRARKEAKKRTYTRISEAERKKERERRHLEQRER